MTITPTADEYAVLLRGYFGGHLGVLVVNDLAEHLERFTRERVETKPQRKPALSDAEALAAFDRRRIVFVDQVCAVHDVNGNPRRVFVGYDETRTILAVADEGYAGNDAAPWVRAHLDNGGDVTVLHGTVADYREMLGLARSLRPYVSSP